VVDLGGVLFLVARVVATVVQDFLKGLRY